VRDAESRTVDDAGTTVDLHRFFRGLITSGRLGAGEKLPTVRQAAADFGVAPGTVQKAYRALEHDGLIVTRIGSGTRVAPGVAALSANVTGHLRSLVDAAVAEGVDVETLADVLRVHWQDTHRP